MQQFRKKEEKKHMACFSDLAGCESVHRDISPSTRGTNMHCYILPIPLPAEYLLKRLVKQGAPQQPPRLHAQAFEKLMLAIPGNCQCFESNFFTLTLSLKLPSHVFFSASVKENAEMPFAASSVMDGFLLTGR